MLYTLHNNVSLVVCIILVHFNWVVPEKIHTPQTDGILEILAGGGSKTLEVQERGGLNLKKSSAGVTSTDNSCNSNV